MNITYYLTDLKISKVDSVFFIEENYSTHALNDNFLKCFAVREPVNLWMLQKTCMYSLPMPLNIVSIPLYFKNSADTKLGLEPKAKSPLLPSFKFY